MEPMVHKLFYADGISSQDYGHRSKARLMESTLFDRTFRNDQGDLVIFQKPNLPILTAVTAILLKFIPLEGNFQSVVDVFAFGALFTWAWLELFQGVNYFRRSLGLLMLLAILAFKLQG
jgi:hypothetical protein